MTNFEIKLTLDKENPDYLKFGHRIVNQISELDSFLHPSDFQLLKHGFLTAVFNDFKDEVLVMVAEEGLDEQ